jgi:hypothetical protein
MTSVSVLAPFQKKTRKVGLDRIAKASKSEDKKSGDSESGQKKSKKKKQSGSWSDLKKKTDDKKAKDGDEDSQRMDIVGEDDADDDDAPRYGGVSGFTWAPETNEMLVTTGGDIYRLEIGGDDGLIRLTKTRQSERNIQYLPDGSGYTALIGDALVRVKFGDHFVDQLDPTLPGGMTMRSYKISPNGERVVFVASNGQRSSGSNRTVNIATYRDRFMKVRTVSRTVSDDPIGSTRTAVFLYDLRAPDERPARRAARSGLGAGLEPRDVRGLRPVDRRSPHHGGDVPPE